jgi:hypothetical protein
MRRIEPDLTQYYKKQGEQAEPAFSGRVIMPVPRLTAGIFYPLSCTCPNLSRNLRRRPGGGFRGSFHAAHRHNCPPCPRADCAEEIYADIEAIHGDADGFFDVFAAIQDAVMFNPVDITGYAIYPLTINANGETYDILEEQDFIDNFDSLILPETLEAIGSQDVDDLIVTSEGVGLANGAMWITNVCLDDACGETQWGILSINN